MMLLTWSFSVSVLSMTGWTFLVITQRDIVTAVGVRILPVDLALSFLTTVGVGFFGVDLWSLLLITSASTFSLIWVLTLSNCI